MAAERVEVDLSLRAQGVSQALGNLDPVIKVLQKISKTTDTISDKMGRMGDTFSSNMQKGSSSAEGFLSKLAKIGIAFEGIRRVAGSVFEEGLSRESTYASLKTLLPQGTDVRKYAEGLRKEAMSGLYGAGTVTDAAKTMMSFGLSADKIPAYLKSISDIAGGNQQSFQSLVLAFSQASSVGKLQGQDKLQMINAGFNPLAELSKMTGKSIAELDAEMSKGMISADMLAQAFQHATAEGGTFFGATEEQMKGLGGTLKSFQAKMDELQAKIYEKIMPLALKIMTFLNDLFDGKYPAIWALVSVVGAVALAVKTYSASLMVAELWTKLLTAKQWLLNIAMNANPVGLVVAAITALVAIVTICIKKYDEWGAALTLILGPLGLVINMVMSFKRHWDSIAEAFKSDGIIAGIKRIGQVLLDAVLYPIQQLFETLGADSIAGKLRAMREQMHTAIIPGQSGDSTMGGEGSSSLTNAITPAASTAMNSGANSVTTGGTRNTQITISLGSLVHNISYNGGIERNTRETTQDIQEALLRVLNAAAATAE